MSAESPETRLLGAGLTLPAAPQPRGSYAPFWCGPPPEGLRRVMVSGQTCRVEGRALAGICEAGTDLAPARHAARVAMLNCLAVLRAACDGDLSRVQQVVRVRGFVRAASDFTEHTAVLDAASELLAVAFPDQALPARTAVGAGSLPGGAWIEIEMDALMAEQAQRRLLQEARPPTRAGTAR